MSDPTRPITESVLARAAEALRHYGAHTLADALDPPRCWFVSFVVPVAVTAHSNGRGNYWAAKKRIDPEKRAARVAWLAAGSPIPPKLPVHVRFTRVAPRSLDGDNLPSSPKFIQDELCRCIGLTRKSGKQIQARDEGQVFVSYHHQEKPQGPRQSFVRVEMWCEGVL